MTYLAGPYRLSKVPAKFIHIRLTTDPARRSLGTLKVGDAITLTGIATGDWVECYRPGELGWISLQQGKVEFEQKR